ncbi:hypothetical protein E2C01_075139 [Portunus trituberculatus]|uniref:Uncharacterized protein n=1 Tax=Portunus trituberculatus TaxID=210409 RepID=A0A5B7IIC4_PORTR|nr:hypothetical protein [Portunus trituberculatus]
MVQSCVGLAERPPRPPASPALPRPTSHIRPAPPCLAVPCLSSTPSILQTSSWCIAFFPPGVKLLFLLKEVNFLTALPSTQAFPSDRHFSLEELQPNSFSLAARHKRLVCWTCAAPNTQFIRRTTWATWEGVGGAAVL